MTWKIIKNIVAFHLPRAPSYGGVRTWVGGGLPNARRPRTGWSLQLGYKEYTQQDLSTKYQYDTNSNKITNNNTEYTLYWLLILVEN